MRIPLERNSLHASAGRLSAPNAVSYTHLDVYKRQHLYHKWPFLSTICPTFDEINKLSVDMKKTAPKKI